MTNNLKSGKELVAKFEAAVIAAQYAANPVSAATLVDRLRKELIEVCDYSIDVE